MGFELADKFGYSPPFQNNNETITDSFYQTGFTLLNKVVSKFNKGSFVLRDYEILVSPFSKINAEEKSLEDYLLGKSNKKPNGLQLPYDVVSTGKPNYVFKNKGFYFNTLISTQKEKTINKNKAIYSYTISIRDSVFIYRVLFSFNSYNNDAPLADRYGVIIQSKSFDDLQVFLTDLGLSFSTTVKQNILNVFNIAFSRAGKDRNKLDHIYQFAPKFVIKSRKKEALIADLKNILTGFVDEEGTNEEEAVINILLALNSKLKETNNSIDANTEFLSILITEKIGSSKISLFQQLYNKLDDRGGEDNFTKFIYQMYAFWKDSNYVKQDRYKTLNDVGPTALPYKNKKIFGFYKNGFNFNFAINYKEPLLLVKKGHDDVVGLYHIFQPIMLPEVDQETNTLVLLDNYVPAFYLKAFDDKAAWDNFEKRIWLGIDIVTILTGAGNVLKFRHLLKLKNANHIIKLKFVLGTVEVASGALGTMLNFVNDCDPGAEKNNGGKKTFCQHLRDFLILLDIATLSIDGIDSLLRAQAKRTSEAGEQLSKKIKDANKQKQIDDIVGQLDEVVGDGLIVLEKNKNYKKHLDDLKRGEIKRAFKDILTLEEEAILKFYTTNIGYKNFNKALRGEIPMTDFFRAQKNLMNQALDKLPNYKTDGLLYRIENLTEIQINNIYKKGEIITNKHFTSASYDMFAIGEAMQKRAYTVLIRIETKTGKLIEPLSTLKKEKEILHKSNTKFYVDRFTESIHPLDPFGSKIKTIIIKEQ